MSLCMVPDATGLATPGGRAAGGYTMVYVRRAEIHRLGLPSDLEDSATVTPVNRAVYASF